MSKSNMCRNNEGVLNRGLVPVLYFSVVLISVLLLSLPKPLQFEDWRVTIATRLALLISSINLLISLGGILIAPFLRRRRTFYMCFFLFALCLSAIATGIYQSKRFASIGDIGHRARMTHDPNDEIFHRYGLRAVRNNQEILLFYGGGDYGYGLFIFENGQLVARSYHPKFHIGDLKDVAYGGKDSGEDKELNISTLSRELRTSEVHFAPVDARAFIPVAPSDDDIDRALAYALSGQI